MEKFYYVEATVEKTGGDGVKVENHYQVPEVPAPTVLLASRTVDDDPTRQVWRVAVPLEEYARALEDKAAEVPGRFIEITAQEFRGRYVDPQRLEAS